MRHLHLGDQVLIEAPGELTIHQRGSLRELYSYLIGDLLETDDVNRRGPPIASPLESSRERWVQQAVDGKASEDGRQKDGDAYGTTIGSLLVSRGTTCRDTGPG